MSASGVELKELPMQTKLCAQLKDIFATVLGTAAEAIETTTSFVELGADSLALSEASQRLHEAFGIQIPFRSLLEQFPTIESVAARIAKEGSQNGRMKEPEPELSLPGLAQTEPVQGSPYLAAPEQPTVTESRLEAPEARTDLGKVTGLERVMQRQLQLMSAQLDLLRQYGGQPCSDQSTSEKRTRSGSAPDRTGAAPNGSRESDPGMPSSSPHAVDARAGEVFHAPAPAAPRRPAVQPYVAFEPIKPGTSTLGDARQQAYLESLIQRISSQTAESKRRAQQHRQYMGDNRWSAGFRSLWKEMFYPLMAERASGSRIWDVDGREYLDITMGFGSLLFGHTPSFITSALHEQIDRGIGVGPQSSLAGDVARLVCELTGMERVTFCNSGTEGIMTALRLARMATKRNKIVVFAGSYHGTFDGVLVRPAASEGSMKAIPMSPGIDPDMVKNVVMLKYNSPESVEYIRQAGHELAAVLVEPIQSRRPDLETREFLQGLRQATEETGSLLIFDEVVTGFRMHPGGAQAMFGVRADLAVYGKALGAGLPIGAVAGKRVYIDAVDGGSWLYGDESYPQADTTFVAGTFFKHPLVMTSAWAGLNYLKSRGMKLYEDLNERTSRLVTALQNVFDQENLPLFVMNRGSLFRIVPTQPFPKLELFYYSLLAKGVYVWENRVCYLSTAHTDDDCDRVLRAANEAVQELIAAGVWTGRGQRPAANSSLVMTAVQAPETDNQKVNTVETTEAQRELWTSSNLSQNGPGSHHLAHVFRFRGALRVDVLRRALQTVVGRHDSLRACFSPDGRQLRISSSLVVDLPLTDLTTHDAETLPAELDKLIQEVGNQPFVLAYPPLFRTRLVRLAEDDHYLLLTISHILADGWSIAVILSELAEIYSAEAEGRDPRLPQPRQFGEYVDWLAHQQKDSSRQDEAYWLACFAEPVSPLGLSSGRRRSWGTTYAGSSYTVHTGPELRRALVAFSAQHGTTLYSTLLAGLSCLLARITGQSDLVIAMASAGQGLAGMPPLVGYCLNLLFHRAAIRNDFTVAEHMAETKARLMEAQEHRNFAAYRLLKDFSGSTGEPRLPVEIAFNVDRDLTRDLHFHELQFEFVKRPADSVSFPFGLMATDDGNDLELRFEYAKELFDAPATRQIASCYQRVLEQMVSHSDLCLSRLDLLSASERRSAIVEWNQTERTFPRDASIHQLFEELAEQTPEKIAVVDGDRHLTYAQLNWKANQLAHHLRALGVQPQDIVAVWLDRSPQFIVAMLAILKAGAAYLPTDRDCPPERLAWMLEQCGAKALFMESSLQDSLLTGCVGARICLEEHEVAIAKASSENPQTKVDARDLAYVIYTSGSTGEPKGIMVPHQAVVRLVRNTDYVSLGREDSVAQASNSAFDAMTFEVWGALLNGARLVIVSREQLLDPDRLEEQIASNGINTMFLTTALVNQIVSVNRHAFASLKQLMFGGEAVNCPRVRDVIEGGKPERLVHVYGPTENTTFSSWHEVQHVGDDDSTVPIGTPIANTRLYVLDAEMEPTPVGAVGELYIGGAGLAHGYLNHPDWTAESFVCDPFGAEPGSRLYRTGDMVRYRRGGAIDFVGRRDDQIKLRGFRIELGEIEHALRSQPGVKEAVVVVREEAGQGKRLVAYVVSTADSASSANLRQSLKQIIPEYMVPSAFVFLNALPLTPNRKVDRSALPEPHWLPENGSEYAAPRSPTEERLCRVWANVLGIDQVGVDDDFFEVGGDSILAIRVIAGAREVGLSFTLPQLYEHPTIAKLAPLSEMPAVVAKNQATILGMVQLTPIQHWFFEQNLVDMHHFNQAALLEVSAPVEPVKMERAVEAVVNQHQALRLRFDRGQSGWRQNLQDTPGPVPFEWVDMSGLSESEQSRAVEAKSNELQRSLNLAQGPLLRVVFFELGPGRKGRLLIIVHHLAVDFVSWGILLDDFASAYEQLQRGTSVAFPQTSTSFQSWASRLIEHANGANVRAELNYWVGREPEAAVPLPVDFPDGDNTMGSVDQVTITLSQEDTDRLVRRAARQANTLVHELLLAAALQAIGTWSGSSRVLIDIESNGRTLRLPGLDVSRTVGWFTSIYPVALEAPPEASGRERLRLVQQRLREVPEGGVGYGLLRYLCSDSVARERLRKLPEAQVCFNYFGKFDRILPRTSPFRPAPERKGSSESPRGQRKYLLEIEGLITSRCLEVRFRYSQAIHRQSTVTNLAQLFRNALYTCLDDDGQSAATYTPADFPLADISQQDLDYLAGELREADA